MSDALVSTREEQAAIAKIEAAGKALAEAVELPEVKDIRDKAEAIRSYLRQQKSGLQAQNAAAILKIKAERRLGAMLRDMPMQHGARPADTGLHDATPTLADLGIERTASHRWQTIASVPEEKFEEYLAQADTTQEEITSAGAYRLALQPHVAHNSGENEWYTPAAYVEAARRVMGGIDLDPASTAEANAVVKASRFYTMDDDGLEQEWAGRVFLNPPYATGLVDRFTRKLIDSQNVMQAVVLSNNATETRWFQDLAQAATALCFPRGRIRYWSVGRDSLSGLQGQVFIYLGDNHGRFLEEFGAFGFVVEAL